MTVMTQELKAKIVHTKEGGLSDIAVSRLLGISPTTVAKHYKQALETGAKKRHEVALASVESDKVKAHYLHMVITSQGIGQCVMVDPELSKQQDGQALLGHYVEQQLLSNSDWLVERGVPLGSADGEFDTSWVPDPSITFDASKEEPVHRRLSILLARALYEHEPSLKQAVDRWVKEWGAFQKKRSNGSAQSIGQQTTWAYEDVRKTAFRIRDMVDKLALYGSTPGDCFLCRTPRV